LILLSKFKKKLRKIIEKNKNVCLLNYIKVKNNKQKWKLEHLLLHFDNEETRIQFQRIISNELSNCMFD
jgi:hypothetical protein